VRLETPFLSRHAAWRTEIAATMPCVQKCEHCLRIKRTSLLTVITTVIEITSWA
jgi:hypothetical protein